MNPIHIEARISQKSGDFPVGLLSQLLERGLAINSQKFGIARTLVRMAEEDAKPNTERLREWIELYSFADSNRFERFLRRVGGFLFPAR